jgi:hypothetical protein
VAEASENSPELKDVFILQSPMKMDASMLRMVVPPRDRTVRWTLLSPRKNLELVRIGESTLQISSAADEALCPVENCEAVDPGQTLSFVNMNMVVLDVVERRPRRVEIKFEKSMDDRSVRFVTWRDGSLRPISMPSVGEKISLSI